MTEEFNRAKDLFEWNKRFFNFVGVWPLESTYVRFSVWFIYYSFHIISEILDFYDIFGNFELMVENLSESTLQIVIITKLLTLRFSKKIGPMLTRTIDSMDEKNFDNPEEIKIYLNYNRIAKKFVKLWITMGFVTAISYWLKPLQFQIMAILQSENIPFILAYRVHLFFEINDTTTYYLAWIYQAPVMYMGIWQTASIGFLFSLILHICGQLSVLSFRIKNLNLRPQENHNGIDRKIFKDILSRHRNIIEFAKDINDVFGLLLLEELIMITVLIGLCSYSALVNASAQENGALFSFALYSATLLLLIYGYCAAGEYLITESTNLYTAYYQCPWYDMPDSFKKQLIICTVGASKPIQLTAGGFYIFSLENFTSIVKTSGGYISMLRTMI